ncbi:hypothetical protein TSUD_409770 [Trifolium subterraneum]|uniref:HAT C-terminal dimerisation domain-containing protein n=1 Tax=Trifolium subterraneum TaxID=3900 RepID=A0A2Z6PIX9_TRISU|nr:hypothetical protein TSUD_409770 [Trifolium subterraneum]
MASQMAIKFEKYWSIIHGNMGIAIVLDPRFKFKWLEYFYLKLYGSLSSIEIENIKNLCYSLFEDYQARTNGLVENSSENFIDRELSSKNGNNANFLSDFDSFVNETDEIQSKTELDIYLEENVLPRSATFEIHGWWKTNEIKYPTLQKLLRIFWQSQFLQLPQNMLLAPEVDC